MLTGAEVDCERVLSGFLGQPVNTITSLGFVVAGLIAYRRGARPPTATLIAAVGVGSVVFHGPMPSWAEFVHDLTIGWMLVWVILTEMKWLRWWMLTFLAVGLLMLVPAIADPSQAVLSGGAVVLILRRPEGYLAVGLLAIGAIVGTLSRTGWPWCRPDSVWQGHGFWHLASAAALALWALSPRQPSARGSAGSVSGPGPTRPG
ncbi:MAG TPA: hypothetical protein VJQ57_10470 [Acidimicrobiia bacterium]|nr:hypothetical protein [Acidimicrobiia bacterium]